MEKYQEPNIIISASSRRSGSTWLQRIVHAATNVFVWGESFPLVEFLSSLYSTFYLNTETQQRETENFLSSNQDPTVWIPNINPSISNLEAAYKIFFSRYYRNDIKQKYGWKEVHYGNSELEFLKKLFPDTKIILLVRNPIHVVQSLTNLGWIGLFEDTLDIEMVCNYWSERTKDYLALMEKPGYFFLRYEDINSRIAEIIEFVGGTYNQTMVQAQNALVGNSKIQKELSPETIQLITSICRQEMSVLGYLDETHNSLNISNISQHPNQKPAFQKLPSNSTMAFKREILALKRELSRKKVTVKENEKDIRKLREQIQDVEEKEKDIQLLRKQIRHAEQTNYYLQDKIRKFEQEADELKLNLIEKETALQALNTKLLEIYESDAWLLIQYLWRARLRLLPSGSNRERLAHNIFNFARGFLKRVSSFFDFGNQ